MSKVKYRINVWHMQQAYDISKYSRENNIRLPMIVHKILYEDIECISDTQCEELATATNCMKDHIKLTKLLTGE